MRDAFGGTFMIQLMLVFLVIYISLLAVGYNYANAFRTKNFIIDYIERYEGYNELSAPIINNFIDKRMSYNVSLSTISDEFKSNHPDAHCDKRGYCIEIKEFNGKTTCLVTTFVTFNIFGIGAGLGPYKITIPSMNVSGEVEIASPYWHNDFKLMEV